MNKLFFILLTLLFFGCDENFFNHHEEEEPIPVLDVYCDNCEEDENGDLYYPYDLQIKIFKLIYYLYSSKES